MQYLPRSAVQIKWYLESSNLVTFRQLLFSINNVLLCTWGARHDFFFWTTTAEMYAQFSDWIVEQCGSLSNFDTSIWDYKESNSLALLFIIYIGLYFIQIHCLHLINHFLLVFLTLSQISSLHITPCTYLSTFI